MDKESLEAPLSMEELHVSLKSLQKGKSLGLDQGCQTHFRLRAGLKKKLSPCAGRITFC